MNEKPYNGWKNHATWNVALYIQNDYMLYKLALLCNSYTQWLKASEGMRGAFTPDGINWHDPRISRSEITEMLRELHE